MKGIILAGGKGTRLHPLTRHTNKHLLPVGREPMIYNPVKNLVACGVDEILVVTSSLHMGEIVACLGSGAEFGADFTYKVQEEARGIADALRLGRRFAGDEPVFVLLGDNIFERPLTHFVENFRSAQGERGARVMLVKVGNPSAFGVAALDERKVVEIQEKPENPKSDYAVVGDFEGVVHWLRLNDGAFAARSKVGGTLNGKPVVADGIVVVQGTDGKLTAFALQP